MTISKIVSSAENDVVGDQDILIPTRKINAPADIKIVQFISVTSTTHGLLSYFFLNTHKLIKCIFF